MNLLPILFQSLQDLWGIVAPYLPAIVLIVVARWILQSRWFKGKFGEFKVNRVLQKCMDGEQYRLIKNVTLPTEDGTTQVDHVLVSVFGVFVIETKNMGGKIFGKPKEEKWTQKFPWRKGYRFQNPCRQNYGHVQAVRALCGLKENQVHSVVVFVGSSRFQSKMPDDVVEGIGNLIDHIKSRTEEVLSAGEVGDVVDKINAGRLPWSMETDRAHVRHVKDIVREKQAKAGNFDKKPGADSSPSCPVCGGGMVERQVRKGANKGKPFWGCPKYPKCRGMRSINGHD
ncbi:MAG: NERD domain-containing protein [Gammaproteobacteria bacterium]|nr:NERD domain-containing protein [Gammaproteobacteria bacterium]